MNVCEHTLYAMDPTGQPTGSWVFRDIGRVRRVECGVCGKFHGRINTKSHRTESCLPLSKSICTNSLPTVGEVAKTSSDQEKEHS